MTEAEAQGEGWQDTEEETTSPNPYAPYPFCPEFGPGSLFGGKGPLTLNYSSHLTFRNPSWPFGLGTGLGGPWGLLLG